MSLRLDQITAETLRESRAGTDILLGGIADGIARSASAMVTALMNRGVVYACGNGGSATQASHFAGELVGRFKMNRRAVPALSLSDNPAIVTALSNDYSFEDVFAHQVRGLCRKGDVLLALSTSGDSENVVRACAAARENGGFVAALTGRGGGRLAGVSDALLAVDSTDTPRIQEVHIMAIHVLCEVVEAELFS